MKNKITAALFAIFLGGFGIHWFYLGNNKKGILYLIFVWTFIPSLIGIFEGLLLLSYSEEDFNNKYNKELLLQNDTKSVVKITNEKKDSSVQQSPMQKDSFEYLPIRVQKGGLQLLESFQILNRTINIDTLIGRYDFINQMYDYFTIAANNRRYQSDVQVSIDNYKTTFYNSILTNIQLHLLLKPNRENLTDFYTICLINCFSGFCTSQTEQIIKLKKQSAKINRLKKVIEITQIAIDEFKRRGSTKDIYKDTVSNFRTQLSEIGTLANIEPRLLEKEITLANLTVVINKGGSFELTLFGEDQEKLNLAVSIIRDNNIWQKTAVLFEPFTLGDIRCKEVDDYIFKYKPIYEEKLNEALEKSAEYKNAAELDKNLIEIEIKKHVVTDLYEYAYCDLVTLFDYSDIECSIDNELVTRYGFDVISKYLGLNHNQGKIYTTWEQSSFEDLLKADLAISGDELDVEEVLISQNLKTLNSIAAKDDGFFKRKNKAIEYILANELLISNIGKYVAKRNIFKLKPLPKEFESIDIQTITRHWAFLKEYIDLIVYTNRKSKDYDEQISKNKEWIDGYKVSNESGTLSGILCTRSKIECTKTYSVQNPPKVPFHIGCQCYLDEIYK